MLWRRGEIALERPRAPPSAEWCPSDREAGPCPAGIAAAAAVGGDGVDAAEVEVELVPAVHGAEGLELGDRFGGEAGLDLERFAVPVDAGTADGVLGVEAEVDDGADGLDDRGADAGGAAAAEDEL